jgi:hypothetical protein
MMPSSAAMIEHNDVGDIGTTRTHSREGRVTGCVDEGDGLAVVEDAVGTDVLGDAPRLPGGDLRLAQGIEQRGLAVIDVTHEGDDRGAQFEFVLGNLRHDLRDGLDDDFLDLVNAAAFLALFTLQLEAVLLAHFFGDLDVDGLVRAGENLEGDEIGDDLEGLEAHFVRQILHHDGRLEMDDLFTTLSDLDTLAPASLQEGHEQSERSVSACCPPIRREIGGRALCWPASAGRRRTLGLSSSSNRFNAAAFRSSSVGFAGAAGTSSFFGSGNGLSWPPSGGNPPPSLRGTRVLGFLSSINESTFSFCLLYEAWCFRQMPSRSTTLSSEVLRGFLEDEDLLGMWKI